jgi:hypothetical protein
VNTCQQGWFIVPDAGREFMAKSHIHGDTRVLEAPHQRWARLKTTDLFPAKGIGARSCSGGGVR